MWDAGKGMCLPGGGETIIVLNLPQVAQSWSGGGGKKGQSLWDALGVVKTVARKGIGKGVVVKPEGPHYWPYTDGTRV